jgi:hypothetical protein
MLDERVSLFKIVALLGHSRQFLFQPSNLGGLIGIPSTESRRKFLPHGLERLLTYTQLSQNLHCRRALLGYLCHFVPFEIITKFSYAHNGLHASKLGNKASTKIEAI